MSLFEQILQTNLINFIIVISTLVLIFKKAKLGLLIDKMAQDIKDSVEKSANTTKLSLDEYKLIKKSMKDIPKQQQEIVSNAKINAQNLKEQIEKTTQNQCSDITNGLEKTFNNQKEKYKNLTIEEIYQAAINLAQKETLKRLDYDTHKNLINLSIEEIDRIEESLL